jgi:hypothetical protein
LDAGQKRRRFLALDRDVGIRPIKQDYKISDLPACLKCLTQYHDAQRSAPGTGQGKRKRLVSSIILEFLVDVGVSVEIDIESGAYRLIDLRWVWR